MPGRLVLLRHGETQWSRSGQHTGLTDIPLTPAGEAAASALKPILAGHEFATVLISPLQRAQQTAQLAGLTGTTDPAVLEWDYGAFEGRTTPQIQHDLGDPQRSIWTASITPGRTPGESLDEVGARADRVLEQLADSLALGDCAIVAHGHFLRILTARWLSQAAYDGRLYALAPGTVSVLGHEHVQRVIDSWNSHDL